MVRFIMFLKLWWVERFWIIGFSKLDYGKGKIFKIGEKNVERKKK